MAKEYPFTKHDLYQEIQDVRETVYRHESEQRERERNAVRIITVAVYCLACGYLIGKPKPQRDEAGE